MLTEAYQSNKIRHTLKLNEEAKPRENSKASRADVELNEIKVTSLTGDVVFALGTDLYDIESTNTTEARILATTTALADVSSNEFLVEKMALENTIATRIPSGLLALRQVIADEGSRQTIRDLSFIFMKEAVVE